MAVPDLDYVSNQPLAVALPWSLAPDTSFLLYNSWVEVELDPGMVLHKILPQAQAVPDSLGGLDFADYGFLGDPDDPANGGVNLSQSAQGTDVIQRMATSTYRFTLFGQGMRAGYQVPIPNLVSVGGISATPDFPHRAYNKVVANACGVPVFFAEWELHYMVNLPMAPQATPPIPPNLAERIRADHTLPKAILVPFAPTDQDAVVNLLPGVLIGPIIGKITNK